MSGSNHRLSRFSVEEEEEDDETSTAAAGGVVQQLIRAKPPAIKVGTKLSPNVRSRRREDLISGDPSGSLELTDQPPRTGSGKGANLSLLTKAFDNRPIISMDQYKSMPLPRPTPGFPKILPEKSFSLMDLGLNEDQLKGLYGFQPLSSANQKKGVRRSVAGLWKKATNAVFVVDAMSSNSPRAGGKGMQNRKKTVELLQEKIAQQEQDALEREEEEEEAKMGRGLSRFKHAAQMVKMANKIGGKHASARMMDHWLQERYNRHPSSEYNHLPWYKRAVSRANAWVKILHLMIVFFTIVDICIMFAEGVSYADFMSHGGQPMYGADAIYVDHVGPNTPREPWFIYLKITLGCLSDAANLIDIFLRFRLADASHNATFDVRAISAHYASTWFWFDILSSMPIYWIFIPFPWVRLNRFLRLWRMNDEKDDVMIFLSAHINLQILRVAAFFIGIGTWTHIIACLTCTMIYTTEDASYWMSVGYDFEHVGFRTVYLRALMYSWCQITNGQGDLSPQTEIQIVWTLSCQVVGAFMYMVVLGKVVAILQNFDLNAAEFTSRRESVATFLRIKDVPARLKDRVNNYFDALWDKKRGMDEHEVIAQLPPFIRHDLSWCLNKHFLEKVPMFMGADATSLMVINQFLTHVIITPGEFLLRSGEIGGAMFFVISGTLTVWDDSVDGEQQEQVAELFEGSVVGEVGVLLNTPAHYDVQAKTTCDLFQLTKDDFTSICDVFPTFRDKLCHRAEVIYGPGWDNVQDEDDQKLSKAMNKMKRLSSQTEDGSSNMQSKGENASSHGNEADQAKKNGLDLRVEASMSEKERIVNGEGSNTNLMNEPVPETPLHFGWKDRQIAQSSSTAKKPDGVFARHISGPEGSSQFLVDAAAGENRGGSILKRREGSGVLRDPSMDVKAAWGDAGDIEKRMSALEDGQRALLKGQDRMAETLSSILSTLRTGGVSAPTLSPVYASPRTEPQASPHMRELDMPPLKGDGSQPGALRGDGSQPLRGDGSQSGEMPGKTESIEASGSGPARESARDVGPALPGQVFGEEAESETVGNGDGNGVALEVEGGGSGEKVEGKGIVPWVEGSGERAGDGDKGGTVRDERRDKAQVQSVAWQPPKFLTSSSGDDSLSSPSPTAMRDRDTLRPVPRLSVPAQPLTPQAGSGGMRSPLAPFPRQPGQPSQPGQQSERGRPGSVLRGSRVVLRSLPKETTNSRETSPARSTASIPDKTHAQS